LWQRKETGQRKEALCGQGNPDKSRRMTLGHLPGKEKLPTDFQRPWMGSRVKEVSDP